MKRAQHAAHNPNSKRWDYSDIPSGGHEEIKRPAHKVESGHHLSKAPNPHPHGICEPGHDHWELVTWKVMLLYCFHFIDPLSILGYWNDKLRFIFSIDIHIHFRLRCCPCPILWGWQHQAILFHCFIFIDMGDPMYHVPWKPAIKYHFQHLDAGM